MNTVAVPDAEPSGVAALIVCAPADVAEVYRPFAVIVPDAALPPIVPSTDHTKLPPPAEDAVNCCVPPGVTVATPGLTRTDTPVPCSVTTCGVPAASSCIITLAVSLPTALAVKRTPIVQEVPAGTDAPHVVDAAKSGALAPLTVIAEIDNGAPPIFVSVTSFS